jgi:hypothetical protein
LKFKHIVNTFIVSVLALGLIAAAFWLNGWLEQTRVLKKMIERLSADSRIAEVLVTKSEYNEQTKSVDTTIKFLEYDTSGQPLVPKYFTFQGNIIQFQSLVIRFEDDFVRKGDKLKGKSAYLFMKAFILRGSKTQEFEITNINEIPAGYQVSKEPSIHESDLWEQFWNYALDPDLRSQMGIKNVQIEAPGSIFVPGTIYTLKIEHDGGIRIDTRPLPEIVKGEDF